MKRRTRQLRLTSGTQVSPRRGNTLILVTAILVLLVIIATAFISRAQGGRVIASAQRKAIDRTDRSDVAVGVIAQEISGALFPKLANNSDPALVNSNYGYAHTSSTPRLRVAQWTDPNSGVVHKIERHGLDPQWFNTPALGYNHAPFIDRPWTNWPDAPANWDPSGQHTSPAGPGNLNGNLFDGYGLPIGDSDPLGNPGFADSRYLRSTEPIRSRDQAGNLTGFSHWQHLSFPATAENGWRVCFDISNVAPFGPDTDVNDPLANPNSGFTITYTAAQAFYDNPNLVGGYYGIADPVALQSPYEQWLSSFAPGGINASNFVDDFKSRRNQWFSAPTTRVQAVMGGAATLPNFFQLNDLGPSRDEFRNDTRRNIVSRTYTDTDGDGFTDAFWFLLPGVSEDGVRQVAAISVIDNASMVDLETATRFDRFSTTGQTPADVALSSRLFANPGGTGSSFDEDDTWTGLFSDPQNTWPSASWGLGFNSGSDPSYWGDNGNPYNPDANPVNTGYDPYVFGDDFGQNVSWLRRLGVVRGSAGPGDTVQSGVEGPFRTLLVSSPNGWDINSARFDRRRYFHTRQTDGRLYAVRRYPNGAWINDASLGSATYMPRSFGENDELELRFFNGANYAPIISSLERTVNKPWDHQYNPFRSSLTRSESVENWLEYTNPDPVNPTGWVPWLPLGPLHDNTTYPPAGTNAQTYPAGHQLTALQLMRDSRHRSTTYSATRNDLRPLWMRPTVLFFPQYDYLRGQAYTSPLLDSANPEPNNDGFPFNYRGQNAAGRLHIDTNRGGYELAAKKIDLRGSLDRPLDDFESKLYAGDANNNSYFPNPYNFWLEVPGPDATDQLKGVYLDPSSQQGQSLMLDRAYRFRTELQNTFDRLMAGQLHLNANEAYYQSYLGSTFSPADSNFNFAAYGKTLLLNASWAANIDTFRDNRGQGALTYNLADSPGSPTPTPVYIDQPIYPNWAPRVSLAVDNGIGQIDSNLVNLTFVGNEKQPFIMETFFGLVYPKSKMKPEIETRLEDTELYTNKYGDNPITSDEDRVTIPDGFPDAGEHWVDSSSEPAIVFAIQIANPYEDPVSLADMRLRIANLPRPLYFHNLPCPHPSAVNGRAAPYFRPNELQLGPTLPDAPRTAIVFGIIPPNNDVGQDFEDKFGLTYPEFHQKWVDFMDFEPGNLFGYDPGLSMPQLQTLVFDASPRTYHKATASSVPVEFNGAIGVSSDLEEWFLEPEVSVELMRWVQNPRTFDPQAGVENYNDGYMYTIDRLDNQMTGSQVNFKEHMQKLLGDPAADGQASTFKPYMPQAFQYTNFDKKWNGIRLKEKDFFATWVRAGRAWGWDRNRNGFYDMNEVSPRYIFSELPADDWAQEIQFYMQDDAPETSIGGDPGDDGGGHGGGHGGGQPGGAMSSMQKEFNAMAIEMDSDPDGDSAATDPEEQMPWLLRSYFLPLATAMSVGGPDGFAMEFETARGKPTHFSTASALIPGAAATDGARKIDYDAGFPVYANGAVRMAVDNTGWPGKPAGNFQWALMDKGQSPNEQMPANRSFVPVGDSNNNGVDDGLENYDRIWLEKDQWAYPLQMLQKNADFDQVGEVANVFMWGHALRFRFGHVGAGTLFNFIPYIPTVATLGEIMNGTRADDLFPVVSADIGEIGIPNPGRIHTNRYYADPGNLTAQPAAAVEPFNPFTPVLEVKQWNVAGENQPWVPMLPAGIGIFDSLVCDGPGVNHTFMPNVGINPGADGVVALHMAYQDDSFDNAGGFTGRPTRGLINVNTASPEVLRTLPHMSRLVYNNSPGWQNTDPSLGYWYGYKPARPASGDVDSNGQKKDVGIRNNQWVRVPEMIDRYRRGEGMFTRVEPLSMPYSDVYMPGFLDRGTIDTNLLPNSVTLNGQYPFMQNQLGLFPGMRRDQGIVSVGELLLLERKGWNQNNSDQSWPQNSVSIRGAGLDPYHYQYRYGYGVVAGAGNSPANIANYPANRLLGLGWRHPFLNNGFYDADPDTDPPAQVDARLSTDVQHTSFRQQAADLNNQNEVWVEIPDNVAMDAEEANMLFSGISNLVGTRSDTFTVYMKIRSFKQNPVTGLWNAMDPEFVVDDSRYVFVVDRSRCDSPNDEPEIRVLSKVPN